MPHRLLDLLVLAAVLIACAASGSAIRPVEDLPRLADRSLLKVDPVTEGTFPFMDVKVSYHLLQQPSPARAVALLLHGLRFTSLDWDKLETMKALGALGYRVVAIDLPGFGKTPKLAYNDNNMRAELIRTALEFSSFGDVNVSKLLVSPSMSGKYALPFVDRYGTDIAGWAAIAPVGVRSWGGPWELAHKQVRLLAMYGAQDPMASDAQLLLKMFQLTDVELLSGAGHQCYVDKTQAFNARLSLFATKCLRRLKIDQFGNVIGGV